MTFKSQVSKLLQNVRSATQFVCFSVSDPTGTLDWKLGSRWAHAGSFVTCCQVCQAKQQTHNTIPRQWLAKCLTPLSSDACFSNHWQHFKHQGGGGDKRGRGALCRGGGGVWGGWENTIRADGVQAHRNKQKNPGHKKQRIKWQREKVGNWARNVEKRREDGEWIREGKWNHRRRDGLTSEGRDQHCMWKFIWFSDEGNWNNHYSTGTTACGHK